MEDRLPAINNTVSRQLCVSAIQRVDDFQMCDKVGRRYGESPTDLIFRRKL
jgi:hypothetical protein